MKKIVRFLSGVLFIGPIVLLTYLFSLFLGREKAVRLWGPVITSIAKSGVNLFIPKLKDASEFDFFAERMKKNFWLWKPFYDFTISQDGRDVFQLNVKNCPFCETAIKLGLPELGPYFCQGDWEVAKENKDKWDFNRTHQIGTGDKFCNHTYLRKPA